ncbi:acylphosphatase [Sporolactobacillus sp. Y61]|uniref:acylphosphatase n=1 Tax=Sporolactobacillus sp. Y61 TaxID=3160863 RepID=A0AAU8IJC5_9BACL
MEADEPIKSVQIMVSGRVQGTGFRYFSKQVAAQCHINGWIRNRDDGRVEIAAEGSPEQVYSFVRKIRRGTFLARVKDMDIHDCMPQGYTEFEIKATM